jgi:hypothetical protein
VRARARLLSWLRRGELEHRCSPRIAGQGGESRNLTSFDACSCRGCAGHGSYGRIKERGEEKNFWACGELNILCVVAGEVRVAIVTHSLHW